MGASFEAEAGPGAFAFDLDDARLAAADIPRGMIQGVERPAAIGGVPAVDLQQIAGQMAVRGDCIPPCFPNSTAMPIEVIIASKENTLK